MLEKERFLAIKKLARDIREDNKSLFKKIDKKSTDEAIKEKNELFENIIQSMSIAFSSGEQGKEEKQIFRANILIPDDEEFYKSYSENKNIRNLMKKYAVNIEDVMSKITELNIYGKYIEENDEPLEEKAKLSPKEAEDLLDEIDSLSNTLTNLDLTSVDVKQEIKEPEVSNEKPATFIKEEIKEKIEENINPDDLLDESFDDISKAISGFVVDFNNNKEEMKRKEKEISSLNEEVKKLSSENDKLNTKILEYEKDYNILSYNYNKLKEEKEKMEKRTKLLEEKLMKTVALLNKVYNGIKN